MYDRCMPNPIVGIRRMVQMVQMVRMPPMRPTPRRIAALSLVLLIMTSATHGLAQPTDEHWKPFQAFVGSWTGDESSNFGSGEGTRTYEFVLQNRYLLGRNESRFPPQPTLPEGDVHNDWSLFSYDSDRDAFALRQFNSEGFVNHFVQEASASTPTRVVFALESSENGPEGLEGRLTLELVGQDELVEAFELSTPDDPELLRIRNRWRRTGG